MSPRATPAFALLALLSLAGLAALAAPASAAPIDWSAPQAVEGSEGGAVGAGGLVGPGEPLPPLASALEEPVLTPGAFHAFTYDDGAGNTLHYQLFVPPGYTPGSATRYPLLVSLHGAGNRRDDNPAPTDYPTKAFSASTVQSQHPHFILHPWCPSDQQWVDVGFDVGPYTQASVPLSKALKAVLAIVEQQVAARPIDPERVYLAGHSMGGYGTLDALGRSPARWAAAIAVCGGGPVPEIAAGVYRRGLPLWLFHGDADPIVPVRGSRATVTALLDAGNRVRYTEYPDAGHNTWTATYENAVVRDWLFSQRRNASAPATQAPVVSAGPGPLTLTLPAFTHAPAGSVTDSDSPASALSVFWDIASGPGRPAFANLSSPTTPITFPSLGTYRLRLVADDGTQTRSSEVTFHVTAPGGQLPSLLGHWRLDEGSGTSIADSTGQNAPGTAFRANTWSAEGPLTQTRSLQTSGASPGLNLVRVPFSPYLSPSDDRMSVAFWVKPSVWDGAFLFKNGSFRFGIAANRLRFSFAESASGSWFQANLPSNTVGTWVHLAFTYDGRFGRFYANGNLLSTTDRVMKVPKSTAPLLLGGDSFDGQSNSFTGLLADVRLYNSALTPAEIAVLHSPPATASFASWISALPAPPPVDQRGHLDDPDRDGLPNLIEYALDLSPTTPAPASPLQSQISDLKLQISFRRARPELTYEVLASSTLAPGSWTVIATNPGSVGQQVTVTDSASVSENPRRFLRLRVTAP